VPDEGFVIEIDLTTGKTTRRLDGRRLRRRAPRLGDVMPGAIAAGLFRALQPTEGFTRLCDEAVRYAESSTE
jgi:hypothetical protein